MNSRFQIIYPILLAIALIAGIFFGQSLSSGNGSGGISFGRGQEAGKFAQMVHYVQSEYVDSVDTELHVEQAIQDFLQELDPHSYYIPASDRAEYSEPLKGNFDGIGVEFRIVQDTVMVINPISGGPSESVGIQAGDRIVMVEDSLIAGVGVNNRTVMDLLRGKRGTEVSVHVRRGKASELIQFTITRGKIPIVSVPVWLKVDNQTGYVRISRFARNTYHEFMDAVSDLGDMEQLVIDLRGNGGGYLQTAIEIADELLEGGKLIVYTEGRSHIGKTYESTNQGSLEKVEVVILINENSASASEILAGAIQDNDRGTIIGRRSFGKGLVQNETSFDDNSAMRLTIARYYTPTGRSIQKPYGEDVEYSNDYFERVERGELISADSISFPDSLKYTTVGGRTVYGGGGIMPDIFVGVDTTGGSGFLSDVIYNGVLTQFAFNYADGERSRLEAMGDPFTFDKKFILTQSIFEAFLDFAEADGYSPTLGELAQSKPELERRIKAGFARVIWGEEGYFAVYLDGDDEFQAAMKHFRKLP